MASALCKYEEENTLSYQVINKELGIASCHVADLTAKQSAHILTQWEDGCSLGELTLFYDSESQNVVLYHDHPEYCRMKRLSERYLAATDGVRERVRPKLSSELYIKAADVLDHAIESKRIARKAYIAERQKWQEEYGRLWDLMHIVGGKTPGNAAAAVRKAFLLGVAQGKHEERKKRSALNPK